MAPSYNEPCYNEDPVITNNNWKLGRITVKYVETNPTITNWFQRSQRTIYPDIMNILSCSSQSVTTTWYKLFMTPIHQDRETLTFKALLYLNVAVHEQVCRLFCLVHVFTVQLGYTPLSQIFFFVNQIFCYNGVFAITKTPLKQTIISVPWHVVIVGWHCQAPFEDFVMDSFWFCTSLV